MSSRTARRVVSLVAAAVLTLALAPAAVSIAAGPSSAAAKPHCASLLSTPPKSGKKSRVVRTKCFARLSSAVRFAAKGAIVPDDLAADEIDDAVLVSGARIAPDDRTTIIGIHWEHAERGGRDRIYYVRGVNPCASHRVWQIPKLDAGWDGIASSAESFGGCGTFTQYAEAKFSGAARTCSPYCAGLGSLNDTVGSVRWRA